MWGNEQTFRDDHIPGGPLMSRCRHTCGNDMTRPFVMWAPAWSVWRTDRESYPAFPKNTLPDLSGWAPLRHKHSWQWPRWVHTCAKTNIFLYHTGNAQINTWILRKNRVWYHTSASHNQPVSFLKRRRFRIWPAGGSREPLSCNNRAHWRCTPRPLVTVHNSNRPSSLSL